MQPNEQKQRKIAIILLVLIIIGGIVFLLYRSNDPNRKDRIYTDPNNGEQVVENQSTTPETTGEKTLTITGRKELITQGVTNEAVRSLDQLFLSYKPTIQLVSVVSESVTSTRKDSGFTYTFEVQIDKEEYFTVEIIFTDSITGTTTLYTKDKKQKLASTNFGLEEEDELPPEESTQ